ncbi:MAG: carbon-nitrogen family hydrolase [Firmicutes bacterium]|nr:carbon-nitrogen family hydrolase [Bacillota bacterium]
MKIALGQLAVNFEDKQSSFISACSLVKTAAKNNDIIFLPEMSLTGFSMNTEKTKEHNRETVKLFETLAKENKIAVGFGWVQAAGEKARNMYTVLDENGSLIAEYAKIHPFSFAGEDKYFEGGNELCRFEYKGVKFGLVICYDLRFPYIFGGDYDVMAVPACWPDSRKDHWLTLLKARAIENQVYVAGINCAGKEHGNSAVFDANGDMLEKAQYPQTILSFDADLDKLREIRGSFPTRQDRKNI